MNVLFYKIIILKKMKKKIALDLKTSLLQFNNLLYLIQIYYDYLPNYILSSVGNATRIFNVNYVPLKAVKLYAISNLSLHSFWRNTTLSAYLSS